MIKDTIKRVEIDETGRLLVYPSTQTFPMIYREGVEVHWDDALRALYSPKPREWSYGKWFRHILDTAGTLELADQTDWRNIGPALKADLLEAASYGA